MAAEALSLPSVTYGECGYCGDAIREDGRRLPLQCQKCRGYFHLSCLRGPRPPALLGDQLFFFTCAMCDPLGEESCVRPNMLWYSKSIIMYLLLVICMKRKYPEKGVA